ncbi:MAG: Sua5/YciO/YrdC/YwlC family protein, partial [Candidatus Bilamarchaeaceae archaeon]
LRMPIITTSANRAGGKAPTRIEEVEKGILEEADLVLDGGPTMHGKPSTIIDLVERKVKRKGALEEGAL